MVTMAAELNVAGLTEAIEGAGKRATPAISGDDEDNDENNDVYDGRPPPSS